MRVIRHIGVVLILVAGLTACQEQDMNERIDEVIRKTLIKLDQQDCLGARESLASIPYQENNHRYVMTYATIHACLGKFATPLFFSNGLALLENISVNKFLKALVRIAGDDQVYSPSSGEVSNLDRAINALLYPGGVSSSSHQNRLRERGESEVRKLELFAFYLLIEQLGLYIAYYGNPGPGVNGLEKGRGPGSNTCFINYSTPSFQGLIDNPVGSTGNCLGINDGHIELNSSRREVCRGVVLLNNIFDMMPFIATVTEGIIDEFRNLKQVSEDFENLYQIPCINNLGAVCSLTDQETCEMDLSISEEDLEGYFIYMIERLYF